MLELEPEVEQALTVQAAEAGTTVTKYLSEIVTREVRRIPVQTKHKAKNLMDLGAPIRELGEEGELDIRRSASYSRDVDFS